MHPIAVVAAMRLLAHQFNKSGAAEPVGKLPCRLLVAPHQRRVNDEAVIHAERQCHLQRFERVVAAIRIARIVGLAHPANEVASVAAIADRGGKREKE